MPKRMTTTVSSKRQITLPAALCREMGINPGQKFEFTRIGPAIMLRRKEMSEAEFRELLDAASEPGMYGPDPVEYVRRVRDGGDLDDL